MKIHRFIDNFDLSQKETEITGEIAHQIIKVLKLKVGEKIELCNGLGIYAMAEIKEINKKSVLVEIERIEKITENKKTTLFCAVLKKENFELVVQKATETGISKIVPIISARTIKTGLNLERLQKIAKEASEQSGRSIVPEILEPIGFEKSLELINESDINILYDISGKELNLDKNNSLHNIFIGPEGGWTTEEIEKVKNLNFKIASLGSLTLRAETAAIISSYLISNLK
jgi:16S rRNA (uracil1498-N3)-methyltransferase